MSEDTSTIGYSFLKVILLTALYMLFKISMSYLFFNLTVNKIQDIFLQIEVSEFLVVFTTLFLFLIIFKKALIRTKKKEKLSLFNFKMLFIILIITICLRLLQDPFFRYENILFKKPLLNPSNIKPMIIDWDLLFKIIKVIILVPILEELFFRRIIFKTLMIRYSNLWLSILLSSLLFSISHLSIRNSVPTLLLGMISAFIYHKTSNIWYSIVFHVFSNLLWLTIYLDPNFYYWVLHQKFSLGVSYWLLIILSIGILLLTLNMVKKVKIQK